MKISKQPCRRQDGGMEVDGDMEVASINIKTLSIKPSPLPMPQQHVDRTSCDPAGPDGWKEAGGLAIDVKL